MDSTGWTTIPDASAWRSHLLNLLMPVVLTVSAVVLSLELGLRIFHTLIPLEVCAADYLIGNYLCQPYFEYDKPVRLGYWYQPGFRLEGMWDPAHPLLADALGSVAPTDRSDAFWYVLETDEMGFPNSEYKWRNQYDVIITGDSFTIRTAPVTWIERLAELSGKSILTLGAPSWGPLNQLEAVKLFGLDKNPEWIILMYFEGNDLINTTQYLQRRASGLSWKEYDYQGVPWYNQLVTPHLFRFWAGRLKPQTPPDTADYRYPVTASTEAGPVHTVLKDVHLLALSADYETLARSDEFAAITKALRELNRLAQAQGSRFLVVYIPSKEHVLWSRIWDPVHVNRILERTVTVTLSEGDRGFLQYEPDYLSFQAFQENHRIQQTLFEDFARAEGIELLNLTPTFWQESIRRGELYHFADPHWNQAGNDLAAQIIFDYLQTR